MDNVASMVRRRLPLLLLAALLALLIVNWLHRGRHFVRAPKGPASYAPNLITFWTDFSAVLKNATPPVPLPGGHIEALINGYDPSLKAAYNNRQDLVDLTDEQIANLSTSHTRYLQQARELAPQLPYKKSSQGIAVAASGEFVPELVVSLLILRRTGSKPS